MFPMPPPTQPVYGPQLPGMVNRTLTSEVSGTRLPGTRTLRLRTVDLPISVTGFPLNALRRQL